MLAHTGVGRCSMLSQNRVGWFPILSNTGVARYPILSHNRAGRYPILSNTSVGRYPILSHTGVGRHSMLSHTESNIEEVDELPLFRGSKAKAPKIAVVLMVTDRRLHVSKYGPHAIGLAPVEVLEFGV